MAKRVEKKSSGVGGKILCLILGLFLGIVFSFGGVAALGYFFITKYSVKSTVEKVNDVAGTDIDYTEFITEEYASKTYLKLFGEIGKLVSDIQNDTVSLNTLNDISPLVEKAVDNLVKTTDSYGLPVDKTELMATTFKNLPNYFTTAVDNTEIGTFLDKVGVERSDMLMAICYGTENEDYILDADGNVVMLDDSKPTTVKDAKESGFESLIQDLPLDALMEVELENEIVTALAYGNPNRYDIQDADGKTTVVMRQVVYLKQGDEFYDADGHHVQAEKVGSIYKIIDGEETVYVKASAAPVSTDGSTTYFGYNDAECTIAKHYQKTKVGDLQTDADELIDALELGTIFGVSPLDSDADELLVDLSFGEEGKHYKLVDTDNDSVNDTLVWLYDEETGELHHPNTIADLTSDDGLRDLMNGIKLSTVLEISPLDEYQGKKKPDNVMILLCYGEENVHYTLVDTDTDGKPDKINWLTDENGETYSERTIGDLSDSDSNFFEEFSLASVLELDGSSEGMMRSIAFGSASHYTIGADGKTITMNPVVYTISGDKAYDDRQREVGAVTLVDSANGVYSLTFKNDDDETVTRYLKASGGVYYAYPTQEKAVAAAQNTRILYQKTTLGDMMGDGADAIVNDLELYTVLDLTPASHPVLIALAYGTEGKDFNYIVEGGEKVGFDPITPPATVYQLKNDNAIFDNIQLAALFDNVDAEDKIMMYVLYGKENIHYALNGGKAEMMQRRIAVKDGVPYNEYGEPLTGATVSGSVFTDVDGKPYTMSAVTDGTATQVSIGKETVSGVETTIYATYYYLSDENGAVYFEAHTLSDLTEEDGCVLKYITKALTVADILKDNEELSTHFLLKHVSDVIIDDLPERVSNLTFKEVYPDDIYEQDENGYYIYYDENGYEQKIENIYYNRDEHRYYSTPDFQPGTMLDLELKPEWKYLLAVNMEDGSHDHNTQDYKLTEFEVLVEHMKDNVNKAKLSNLCNDGLITIGNNTEEDKAKLENTIIVDGESKKIGDLTISQLISAISGS